MPTQSNQQHMNEAMLGLMAAQQNAAYQVNKLPPWGLTSAQIDDLRRAALGSAGAARAMGTGGAAVPDEALLLLLEDSSS